MPFGNKATAQQSTAGFIMTGKDNKFESFLFRNGCCAVFDLKQNIFIKKNFDELKNDSAKRVKIIVIGDGSSKQNILIADLIHQVGEILGNGIKSKVNEFRLQVCHQGAQAEKDEKKIRNTLEKFNSHYKIIFSCPEHFSDISSNPPTDTSAEELDEFLQQEKSGKVVAGQTYDLEVKAFNDRAPNSEITKATGNGLGKNHRTEVTCARRDL